MVKKSKLDYILSVLESDLRYVEKLIKENDMQDYIDNFKIEKPDELLYGIYRSSHDIYEITNDERFKDISKKASELYTKLKSEKYELPIFHF